MLERSVQYPWKHWRLRARHALSNQGLVNFDPKVYRQRRVMRLVVPGHHVPTRRVRPNMSTGHRMNAKYDNNNLIDWHRQWSTDIR